MTSSSDRWVIQCLMKEYRYAFRQNNEWETLSRGATVAEFHWSGENPSSPMQPIELEKAIARAREQTWNGTHYHFRFYNVDTHEEISFDLFPEIGQ